MLLTAKKAAAAAAANFTTGLYAVFITLSLLYL
jgi:hypothetical protein